jgi:hypothetical protein
MASDERLARVADFVTTFLEAAAALSIAALGESDDDTYLAIEAHARSMYASDVATPLGPTESRWAVPGGTMSQAPIDVSDSVAPPKLFAIGELPGGDSIAFVGSQRDSAGTRMSDAYLIAEDSPRTLLVRGRVAVDPFSTSMAWEAAGGDPVPLDAPVARWLELAEPLDDTHAEYLAARIHP